VTGTDGDDVPEDRPRSEPIEKGRSGYWAGRLGSTTSAPRAALPGAPPAYGPPPASGPPATNSGPADPPPRSWIPPTAYAPPDSSYTPPDSRRNWTIAIGVSVIVIAGLIAVGFLASSALRHVESTAGSPSVTPRTIGWYWGTYAAPQTTEVAPPLASKLGPQPLNMDVDADAAFEQIVSASDQAGATYYVALDRNGNAWAWGTTTFGALGEPDLTTLAEPTEVSMPPGVRFTQIVASGGAVLALDSTGHIWGWGYDGTGQLGIGTQSNVVSTPTPLDAPATLRFTSISAGLYDTLAVDASGHAWSWGTNSSGTLGDGNATQPSLVPVQVAMPAGVTVTAVAAGGDHSLALDSTGKAWAWGRDLYGDLGVTAAETATGSASCGPTWRVQNCSDIPVPVAMPAGVRFTAVAAGGDLYSEALDSSGRAWAWGINEEGDLGTDQESIANPPCILVGPCTSAPLPVDMPTGVRFVALTINGEDTAALDSAGHVWWWGKDIGDQLGAATNACAGAAGTVSAGPCSAAALPLAMPSGITFRAVDVSPFAVLAVPRK